jgi:hypothetical protein
MIDFSDDERMLALQYTSNDIASLKIELRRLEQKFMEPSPNRGPIEKVERIIQLLELGCERVQRDPRGLLVEGRFIVGPKCWSRAGKNRWYRYSGLPDLVKQLQVIE